LEGIEYRMLCLPAASRRLVCRSFAQHATTMFFPHLIGDAGPRQSRTSSAKGALGRHERHDSAGMRLAYCRGGIGVREDGGTGAGLRAGAVGGVAEEVLV